MSWISESAQGVVVSCRVVPRAARNEIQGLLGEALKVRLQAPPVEGKANEALVKFLAKTLGVPPRAVAILSGHTGRNKRVLLTGLTESAVRRRLAGTV
ncbi:MAG: YggU family protein [Kiritimatiellae bacterium]|nr:YggU family protein [Kiritimatiellia bacterium]